MRDFLKKIYDDVSCAVGVVAAGVLICAMFQCIGQQQALEQVEKYKRTLPNYRDSLAAFDAKNKDSIMRWSDAISRGAPGADAAMRDLLAKKCLERTNLIKRQQATDARFAAYRDSVFRSRNLAR